MDDFKNSDKTIKKLTEHERIKELSEICDCIDQIKANRKNRDYQESTFEHNISYLSSKIKPKLIAEFKKALDFTEKERLDLLLERKSNLLNSLNYPEN